MNTNLCVNVFQIETTYFSSFVIHFYLEKQVKNCYADTPDDICILNISGKNLNSVGNYNYFNILILTNRPSFIIKIVFRSFQYFILPKQNLVVSLFPLCYPVKLYV